MSITPENHYTHRVGWLRAAVLGANDGIISTASLVAGVAASHASLKTIILAGAAGLVSGAMAMATGEYVSVSSQADSEHADLAREKQELKDDPVSEHKELTEIYIRRGLQPELADEVAAQLMKHDALGAHARDELGITEVLAANPIQAAMASAASFAVGASFPLLLVLLAPPTLLLSIIYGATLIFLAILGAISGWTGGSSPIKAAIRVAFWGALAMAATSLVGALLGQHLTV